MYNSATSYVNFETNRHLLQVIIKGYIPGRTLAEMDKQILLAVASAIFSTNELRNEKYLNAPQHRMQTINEWQLYVELNEEKSSLKVFHNHQEITVEINGSKFIVERDSINLAKTILIVKINNNPYTIQLISKSPNGYYQIM